jgi:hypothetical protein
MTARAFFVVALACQRRMAGPRPLTCQVRQPVIYRLFGSFRYIKDLSLSLLAHLVDIGAFRSVPSSPKCAKFLYVNPWRAWGTSDTAEGV